MIALEIINHLTLQKKSIEQCLYNYYSIFVINTIITISMHLSRIRRSLNQLKHYSILSPNYEPCCEAIDVVDTLSIRMIKIIKFYTL